MKKILTILLLGICYIVSQAQNAVNFEIQADASFINPKDGKNFVVIPFEGKSQKELYSDILIAVTRLYNSPKDVISKVENEIISVNGISSDCTFLKVIGMRVYFSIQYVLQFQFKDGKIRVDAPVITRLFTDKTADIKPISGWLNAQKVFKKGEPNPKKQETIDGFNNTLNGLINQIVFNEKNQTQEEW